jgi:hypothetical protein
MDGLFDAAFFLIPLLVLGILFVFRRLSDPEIELNLAEDIALKNGVSYWGAYKR